MRGSGRDRAVVWGERLRRFEQAGLTVAEFCRQEGVSAPSFYQWRKRLANPSKGQRFKAAAQRSSHSSSAFQQVMLSAGAVVTVELPSGVRIDLPAQQEALVRTVLADLLEAEARGRRGDV
jgi:hypothetical protein